jgi:tetratricopeptide (TPR) repeat protein
VNVDKGELRVVERKNPQTTTDPTTSADPTDWFGRALEVEGDDPKAAKTAYERAVKEDPENAAAWVNFGRLLHESGSFREAEEVYRRGLRECESDAVLLFNLGVVLEDQGRSSEALESYQLAIGADPTLADCHYNLARLYEASGKPQHAIRHLVQYRRLLATEH